MVAINAAGLALGITLTILAVVLHFQQGTGWSPGEDISQEILDKRAAQVEEPEFPEPMNRAIGGGGGAAAVPAGEGEAELAEGATADEAGGGPADIPEDEIEHYEIEFAKEGETIEVANNETLLDRGEEEGWDLPYACRQGQCVSCGGQIDGDSRELVEHDDQDMLDDDELSEGYTLTCVAYPRGEFTLETNETP
jgi:2Fe-2S type ferredoxin